MQLVSATDNEAFRLAAGVLSSAVCVLFLESEESLNVPDRVQDLVARVEVMHIAGRHVDALQSIASGEAACTLAMKIGRAHV